MGSNFYQCNQMKINQLQNPTICLIEITQRCNLSCPVCYRQQKNKPETQIIHEPSVSQIIEHLKEIRKKFPELNPTIAFTGGEPTLRDDLPELVEKTHEIGFKRTEVMTNGIRIAEEFNYAVDLRKAGLSQVGLQFEGFNDEIYRVIRGRDLADKKRRALSNLKRLNQATILAPCILAGISEKQISEITAYALSNRDFIEHINFQCYMVTPSNSVYFDSTYCINKEQITSDLELSTKGIIKQNDFFSTASIKAIPDFIEALTGKKQRQFFPIFHPDCNLTTYVYVDNKGKVHSINELLDIPLFLAYLDEQTSLLRRKSSALIKFKVTGYLFMSMLRLVKSSVIRKAVFHSIRQKAFDPLDVLSDLLMISCEDYMNESNFSQERNHLCGLFYLLNTENVEPFCQFNLKG